MNFFLQQILNKNEKYVIFTKGLRTVMFLKQLKLIGTNYKELKKGTAMSYTDLQGTTKAISRELQRASGNYIELQGTKGNCKEL